MTNSKQLIVLSGGGRKGIVKLTAMAGSAKGTCSLDFRPAGATLYLVGDGIAQIPLKDMNTPFDVPFLSNGEASCLVRSSSLTMFGGALLHSEIIKKVDSYIKNTAKPAPAQNSASDGQKSGRPYGATDNGSSAGEHDEGKEENYIPKEPQNESAEHTFAGEEAPSHQTSAGTPYDVGQEAPTAENKGARSALSDIMSERDRFDGNNFYFAVKPQLDEMFVCYPEEQLLTATVERSKWVRVDASDGAYAVGILYDGDEPAFICYAVPERTSRRRPPAEIEDMCVWLPVSSREIVGYWVIYQSAKTGEIIK